MRRAACSILILLMAFSLGAPALLPAQNSRQGVRRPEDAFPPTETFPTPAREVSAPPAIALDDNSPEKKPVPRPRSGSGDAQHSAAAPSPWTTFGALAVVIILILVMARVWKKHGPLAQGALPPEVLEMLGRKIVDQRQAIHLVRLGSRILVLGASPAGLTTLAEITDPVEVDFLAGLCQRKNGEGGAAQSFRALFKTKLPEQSAVAATTATVTSSASRVRADRDLEQRLRRTADSPPGGSLERLHG